MSFKSAVGRFFEVALQATRLLASRPRAAPSLALG